MGDNFRGFGEMLVNVLKFLAGSALIGMVVVFFASRWLDSEFGDGTSAPVIAFALGGLLILLVGVVFTVLANMTHRSAGDDIVAIFAGMVDAMNARDRGLTQVRKEELKARQIEMKDEADANKQERSLAAWFTKRDAKTEEARRKAEEKRQAEEQALEADWAWYDEAADDEVEVIR